MYRRFKDRFGTAGVVLGVIAIVLAIGGSAIAASGLSGKQKKEVKSIAKSFAGKPGAPGAPGAPGTAGTNGTNGKDGAPGADGVNGKSVTVATEAKGANCKEGGSSFEAEGSGTKQYACNGSPWTAGGTLPKEATETGGWYGTSSSPSVLSFAIPLAAALDVNHVHAILANGKELTVAAGTFTPEEIENPPACTGTAASPKAKAGHLCVYVGFSEGAIKPGYLVGPGLTPIQPLNKKPEEVLEEAFISEAQAGGADRTGARLMFYGTGAAGGTFAVTAP